MIARVIICFIICVFASQANAQSAANCAPQKSFITELDVVISDSSVREVSNYPLKDLREYRKKNFYKWKHPEEDTFWISDLDKQAGGFYRAGIGADVSFSFIVVPYEGDHDWLSCVFLEHVKVVLYYDGVSFLSPIYNSQKCSDVKTLISNHIKKRHSVSSGIIIKTRGELTEKLPNVISRMEHAAVTQKEAMQKVEKIKKSLQVGIKQYSELMRDQIIEINSTLLTPKNITEQFAACNKK